MKFAFSLMVTTLAVYAKANNDTCNPLFSAFIGVPGFRINSVAAEAVVTNPQPVVLAVEERKFRCGNL
ncbi:hypothetical protein SARC_08380 [Sphaeroforma arctica JP610]|uniref:Uncharacterized protein n=1 Tax=Sphaeroforma arctica JP610 TaxID=667725 RepID=A0A0L0FRM2_9EUKA|nr:hypothetical protein SARC_08380 [Sphaeroforma arctica JP610]KNC79211.1 hypothetical protein SARC_08380 [Sphaeroforma arctica JP610]|eukprot:XP_014153113.1 hypothetical protein SARC_08380 [Sphaeroforma arctica JP610]